MDDTNKQGHREPNDSSIQKHHGPSGNKKQEQHGPNDSSIQKHHGPNDSSIQKHREPDDGRNPGIRKVTRKDIAARAGVSVSVVSRAINNSGYVKKEVKERILAIAEELHYTPNPVAMTLQQRKTRLILFICKDLHNAFNIDLYDGMLKKARERGYLLLLIGKLDFAMLRETMIDGIILPNDFATYDYDRRCGKNYYLPAVSACFGNRFTLSKAIPFVEWNLFEGMEKAVAYLRQRGHRRIALACSDVYGASDTRTVAWIYLMRDTLKDELPNYHLGVNSRDLYDELLDSPSLMDRLGTVEERIINQEEENFFEHGLIAAKLFLQRKLKATAIICFNDELAFGVLQGLREEGLRVPEDLSVLSFDGSYHREYAYPKLTSVTCFPGRFGEKLVDLLADQIEGKEYHYVNRVSSTILEGESVRDLRKR